MTPTETVANLTSLEKELLLGESPHWGSWMFECGEGLLAKYPKLGMKHAGSIHFDTALADEVIHILRTQRGEVPMTTKSEAAPAADIQATLAERGSRYGDFADNARVSRSILRELQSHAGWAKLDDTKKEALTMIGQKIARMLNGDPEYRDNWHDIAGYAQLAEERCRG